MSMTFKWKRATERDLAHTEVYVDGMYIGYVIKESLPKHLRAVDVNWHFVSKTPFYWGKRGRTKKEVIEQIILKYLD